MRQLFHRTKLVLLIVAKCNYAVSINCQGFVLLYRTACFVELAFQVEMTRVVKFYGMLEVAECFFQNPNACSTLMQFGEHTVMFSLDLRHLPSIAKLMSSFSELGVLRRIIERAELHM